MSIFFRCCISSFYSSIYSFNVNLLQYKNDFQLLLLNERNIGEIYKQFQRIDTNNDLLLQYYEFILFFEVESTKFLLLIFDIYDSEKIGKKKKIKFCFLVSLFLFIFLILNIFEICV